MRAKSLLLLMLALGCGLVASIGITQVMANRNSGSQVSEGETQQIFVALADIPTGDRITAEMLRLEDWPKDKVPSGALTKLEQVEGRRPKTKIWEGEVILDNKLLGEGMSPGASEEIPIGYRVVSVRVDAESGISDMIRPGDRVDVLLYMKRSPGTIVETGVRTIFQDVKVFAVNDVFNLETAEGQDRISAKTVSLLVTPAQVEKFTLASELGEIRLTLRSHEDKGHLELTGAFPPDLNQGEVSDRDKEELVQTPPETVQSDKLGGFLELLRSQQSQDSPFPEIAQAPDNWTMQLIAGSEVSEVVLEMVNESPRASAADASLPGFNFWRMISPLRDGRSLETAADPGTDAPAEDEEEEEAEEQEEQDETGDFDD